METKLADYGIHNEKSDIRLHVCPKIQRVYLYETKHGVAAIATGRYQKKPAGQYVNGQYHVTASGYLVPVFDIVGCQEFMLPDDIWRQYPMSENDSTSKKGMAAVRLVRAALIARAITLPGQVAVIEEKSLQIDGVDLIVQVSLRLQVKCDFRGGNRALGGTGNLYLQTSELNPLKAI